MTMSVSGRRDPADEGRVLADHGVLDAVRDQQHEDEVGDRQLADLALAAEPQQDHEDHVHDRAARDDVEDAGSEVGDRHGGLRCIAAMAGL